MSHRTANIRFEYDVGEIVLCFEPDPTKARVLYEAKVIEKRTIKEAGGKKVAAYLVHFQGWNSSWDRQVEDKFLLRATQENRELMRKLTDAAKKYCKKNSQRRRTINAILHNAFGGAPPEFATLSDSDESAEESESDKRPGKGKGGPERKKQKTSLVDFEIPESLRAHLEDDYFFINKKNKLTMLPAKPCVIDILESFMKTFCVNYLCDPSGGREKTRTSSSKHTLKCPPDKCVSLCKEFVDSLRVIFDHTLPVVLLYAAEQQQYETAMKDIKPIELCADPRPSESQAKGDNKRTPKGSRSEKSSKGRSASPNVSEHDSTPPPRRVTRQAALEHPASPPPPATSPSSKPTKGQPAKTQGTKPSRTPEPSPAPQDPIIPIASRTRRRSQFDVVDSEVYVKQEVSMAAEADLKVQELPGPSQSEEVYLNGQDPACSGTESLTLGSSRGREDAMDHILGWQLMPPEVRHRNPLTPSQVYGTVHLLRMFVKLPELLKKMNMKDVLLQIIVKFVHHCLQYLVDHQPELFNDHTYIKA